MHTIVPRIPRLLFGLLFAVLLSMPCAGPVHALVDGSLYETTVTVANPVGTALTNYQAMATVDTSALVTASKLRSDCADLRVTDTDKATALSFWIESGCNTSTTKIWVKPTGFHLRPIREMHTIRIRAKPRLPYLFAGEDQHRRGVADQCVEQDVKHCTIGHPLGVGGGIAIEAILADIEEEGR